MRDIKHYLLGGLAIAAMVAAPISLLGAGSEVGIPEQPQEQSFDQTPSAPSVPTQPAPKAVLPHSH